MEIKNYDVLEALIIVVMLVLIAKFLYKEFVEDIVVKRGWESAKMRQRREDHELLIATSKSLAILQEKYKEDDRGLELAFEVFINEVRESFEMTNERFKELNEEQLKRKEHSIEIQQQMTDSINKIMEHQKERDDKIIALMYGSKELLGNTIDERYEKYITMGCIPQNEVQEFDSIYDAYKKLNGNSGRKTKYEYVKANLPVMPVKTELIK